MHIYNIIIN